MKLTDIVKEIIAENTDGGGYIAEPLSTTLKIDGIEFVLQFTYHSQYGQSLYIELVPKQGSNTFEIPKAKVDDIAERVVDALNKARDPQSQITFRASSTDSSPWISMDEKDKFSMYYNYADDIVKKIANQFK